MVIKYKKIPFAEEIMREEKKIIIVVDEDLNAYTNENIKKLSESGVEVEGLVFCG